jgi:steroid delta-isomerase-like uncharacterized protein
MKTKLISFTICAFGAGCLSIAKSDSGSLPALTVPAPAGKTASLSSPVSKEARNKAIAMRVFDENFNQGRFEVANEIYAKDFENHGLHRIVHLQEDQEAVHAEKKAFPDLKMTVDLMVAEGDLVSVLWSFRGTHTAAGYGGLPPTGANLSFRGITVWRMADGRIHDEWTAFNELTVYRQIASQVKWPLIGMSIALLTIIIFVERLVWFMIRKLWSSTVGRTASC